MRRLFEQTEKESCWNKAKPEEMIFVLLGRDVAAPIAIRAWIAARVRFGKNEIGDKQLVDAERVASAMETER